MKVKDYLQAKYGMSTPTTMMAVEAKVFGIPYPLESGWLRRYGDAEVCGQTAKKLRCALTSNGSASALNGLRVLDGARIDLAQAIDPTSPQFLQGKAWKRLRLQALNLHGRRCQCCGAGPADGAVLNVDHIRPRRLFPELALRLDNLQVLCGDCNEGKGNWDMTDVRDRAMPS